MSKSKPSVKSSVKSGVRSLYQRYISDETRFRLYKLRNKKEVEKLKTQVNYSEKGNFSLRRYYENECLFIHITKSAGTSLALSLFGELPYHHTAQRYQTIFGKKDFNRFFKFTFVRNPWDRLYSAFSYLKGGGWYHGDATWAENNLGEVSDFTEFVMDWLTPETLHSHMHFWPQSRFICSASGKPMVDFLGYFECIDEDYETVKKRLNIPSKQLKHTNSSKRAGYQEVYSPGMISKVEELYQQDIDNFGYHFDSFDKTAIVDGQFKRIEIKK